MTAPSERPQSTHFEPAVMGGNIHVGGGTTFGPNCVVHPGARIGANIAFGSGVIVHADATIGDNSIIGDHAVIGKQPVLAAASTAARDPLPGLRVAERCTIGACAVINAGTTIGARSLIGDQAMVRERVTVGDDVVLGRGVLVENDTSIGSRTKVQANAYLTAYMLVEDDCFIAPCVMTTNDNYMGRTERRFAERGGPRIRRGARIGGGCVLLPNVEIGSEAFVGAGAVVTRDVPPRMLVVGSPARELREVAADELLPS